LAQIVQCSPAEVVVMGMSVHGSLLIATVALSAPAALEAQQPPAIHGVTGTVATEETIKDEHKAANKIVVKTEDGVEHVFGGAKDALVHGGKDLSDLKPGTTVVVHYTADAAGESAREIDRVGTDGLSVTEGMVTKIDRGKKQIQVRYDNGRSETLTLTAHAAVDGDLDYRSVPPGTTRIVVYYSEEAGHKLAHYFRPKG
jgi:archaellum component FlaG (FlaF/FlaG flagellin family)